MHNWTQLYVYPCASASICTQTLPTPIFLLYGPRFSPSVPPEATTTQFPAVLGTVEGAVSLCWSRDPWRKLPPKSGLPGCLLHTYCTLARSSPIFPYLLSQTVANPRSWPNCHIWPRPVDREAEEGVECPSWFAISVRNPQTGKRDLLFNLIIYSQESPTSLTLRAHPQLFPTQSPACILPLATLTHPFPLTVPTGSAIQMLCHPH